MIPIKVMRATVVLGLMGLAFAAHAQQTRPEARPASIASQTTTETAIEGSASASSTEAPQPDDSGPAEVLEASANTDPVSESTSDPSIGPETNLPLPRYVSLKTDEGNVRRGPSLSHRIDWVFLRRDMPLQVIAEYGHWRRVVDREGLGGWVHYALLSGTRTVIVDENMLAIRVRPSETAPEAAQLEAGVIARLGECNPEWCRISAGGYRGWALKTALWGVGPDEIRE